MKALPTLTYAFMWPPFLLGEEIDLSTPLPSNIITFFNVGVGYIQEGEWVRENKFRYRCMSCASDIGEEWYTSSFRPLESGTIPNHVEMEIEEHVRNHTKFGLWGVSYYKTYYAKANRT